MGFSIPGNIKTEFLPFILTSEPPGPKPIDDQSKRSSLPPAVFTYRTLNSAKRQDAARGKLNFLPSSINSLHINKDISFQLLYGRNPAGEITDKSVTFNDILDAIPGVQIREYLPDTRLDQCLNLFTRIGEKLISLFKPKKDASSSTSAPTSGSQPSANTGNNQSTLITIENLSKNITACCTFTMNYLVGNDKNPNFSTDLNITDVIKNCTLDGISYNTKGIKDNYAKYFSDVISFPYTLYYTLQTCKTTNFYEIPAIDSTKRIISSTGSDGWGSTSDIMSAGGFRASNLLGKIPGISKLANLLLGNIGINYTPWWDAAAGTGSAREPEIDIKFDLFNDSTDAAMINFIFINTIVPNNKWIQYGMFQHSPHIYDVKIEGVNRLFACSGDFTVTYDGILRDPPAKWIEYLVTRFGNSCINQGTMITAIKNNKLIKIPDVYHVNLKFKSLLPANFNNYVYTYAANGNVLEYNTTNDTESLKDNFTNAIAKYVERVEKVWDSGKEEEGFK